ncbi:MAG: sensor histidine kinase [Bacteroidia bacterium]|nr:sensor histidine kinase [Bacteroidia bacterium]
MLLALFRRITLSGVRKYQDADTMRRVLLINQFTWLGAGFHLVGIVFSLILGQFAMAYILGGTVILYVVSIFSVKAGRSILAVSLQIVACSVEVLCGNLMYDVGGMIFLYYFPLVMSVVFLLNHDGESRYMYFNFGFLATSAVSSILLLNLNIHIGIELSARMIRDAAILNTALSSLLTISILLLYLDFNRKAQKRLEKIIRERELLLAEVHHRVKNNLAIISGLLNLQKNMLSDKGMQQVLEDSRSRVASMALIHDRLYKNRSFSSIDFDSYVKNLLDEIERGYGLRKKVKRDLRIINVNLDLNSSIPCGLILNELVTNSYKHAFRKSEGAVFLEILQTGNHVSFHYADNGPGAPNVEGITESESLGTTIITSLVEQLEGTFRFYNDDGLHFVMEFEFKSRKAA